MPSSTLPADTAPPLNVIHKNIHAARSVFHILMLNAWRKRRFDVQEYGFRVQWLETQMKNLNIQNTALRSLLDSENDRVRQAHDEVQQMLVQVKENIQERKAIIM
ncbi:hypothetical protein L9F63_016115, partial [Diploptera punctata]